MPWRLIVFILIFAVFLAFITFNLENSCDISFGVFHIPNVPVFITIFTSFVLGLICALPLVMHIKKRRAEMPVKEKKADTAIETEYASDGTGEKIRKDAEEAKKRFFSKRQGG